MALPALKHNGLQFNDSKAANRLRDRDPTLTLGLRNRFVAQMKKRFGELSSAVWVSVAVNDCFGLKEVNQIVSSPGSTFVTPFAIRSLAALTPIPKNAFQYRRSEDKVNGFMGWLNAQESKGVLEYRPQPGAILRGQQPWSNTWIQTSYQKGIAQGRQELRAEGASVPSFEGDHRGLNTWFNQPFHADKVGLIYTRVFGDLKGVTGAMDAQMSRVLALGLAEGKSPYAIAYDLRNRIDKIGLTRAKLIARTEIVKTHNDAKLNELEAWDVELGEETQVQWWTALDERVRDRHRDRHGKVYDKKKARTLIGEPNCRCALLTYIPSMHEGEKKPKVGAVADDWPSPFTDNDYVRKGGKWRSGGSLVNEETRKKLDALRIPPDWRNVVAARDPSLKIQAVGLDSVGRRVYRYSAASVKEASVAKFNRVKLFSRDMPGIRKAIDDGIGTGDSRAYLLRIEDKTAVRIGSDKDLKARKKAYGLTTLLNEHIQVDGNRIKLNFPAKKGTQGIYEIRDSVLSPWLVERKATTKIGEKLFPDVSAKKLNAYLKQISGGKSYSIKDFRTYHGTRIAFEELSKLKIKVGLSTAQKGKIVKDVSAKVGSFLQNTPEIAKRSYINPMVWEIIGGI